MSDHKSAYDAVYASITPGTRHSVSDDLPLDPVHRNAMIWRAVQAALEAEAATWEQRLAAVRNELDSWQATLDTGVMAGTEWERCLAANLPTLRNAIGETP